MAARLAAFLQGLQQLGWSNDRNVRIDIRWGAGSTERSNAPTGALTPDVILLRRFGGRTIATGDPYSADRLHADPLSVGAGYVDSLARPGGNATGFTLSEYGISEVAGVLKEIAPNVTRAAVLRDATIQQGWLVGAIQHGTIIRDRGEPYQRAGRQRVRARRRSIRAHTEWRLIVTERAAIVNREDHAAVRYQLQQCTLALIRRRRWPDSYAADRSHPLDARRQLRRSHPEGKAG